MSKNRTSDLSSSRSDILATVSCWWIVGGTSWIGCSLSSLRFARYAGDGWGKRLVEAAEREAVQRIAMRLG